MPQQKSHHNSVNRLKRVGILNERIEQNIYSTASIEEVERLVKKYLRYYRWLDDFRIYCGKKNIPFDNFQRLITNIDWLQKSDLDRLSNYVKKVENKRRAQVNLQGDGGGSIRAVSGGLPSLGKRR